MAGKEILAGKKILIIEDNPMNMELAAVILESAGCIVIQADTAGEGIRLALESLPDLILMDIALPDMDGLAATGVLKREGSTGAIPIVALTAHAMKGVQEKALGAGCDGCIFKPINTREFAFAVAGHLK